MHVNLSTRKKFGLYDTDEREESCLLALICLKEVRGS
jgi:hypothetical protein